MSGTVYIAGPMRGYPLWNFPAFDDARDRWKSKGWNVISPADLDREVGFSEHADELPENFMREAMARDLVPICRECDAIALLPGWEQSSGVAVELALARVLGLREYDAVTMGRLVEESVCVTAERIVGGDRRNQYGDPRSDYGAATAAFNAITRRRGVDAMSAEDGIMFMLCVKMARLGHKYKLDSVVDLCGYAKCLQLVNQGVA